MCCGARLLLKKGIKENTKEVVRDDCLLLCDYSNKYKAKTHHTQAVCVCVYCAEGLCVSASTRSPSLPETLRKKNSGKWDEKDVFNFIKQ